MLLPYLLGALSAILPQQPGGGDFLPSWELPSGGTHLLSIHDLDGDGIQDWLLTNPSASSQFDGQGSIAAISGKTGESIWEFFGPGKNARMGKYLPTLADLDHDQKLEIILPIRNFGLNSAPDESQIIVLESATGTPLWVEKSQTGQTAIGYYLVTADLDGDGNLEVLTITQGSGSSTNPDRVICISGDGVLLWETPTKLNTAQIICADLDGDSYQEVLVLDPLKADGRAGEVGQIIVIDGRTGSIRWEKLGSNNLGQLGNRVELNDFNHDGILDIFAACPNAKVNGVANAGTVIMVDGNSGHEIWHIDGSLEDSFVGRAYQIADINADGIQEILLGDPSEGQFDGSVTALNSATGSTIWKTQGALGSGEGLGQFIQAGDFYGTGSIMVLVEARDHGGFGVPSQFNGLHMLRGSDGFIQWSLPFNFLSRGDPEYQVVDFDHDGQAEFLFIAPRAEGGASYWGPDAGIVAVIDADGHFWWMEKGENQWQEFGDHVLLSDINQDGVKDLIIRSQNATYRIFKERGMLEAFDGRNGNLIWRKEGATLFQRLAEMASLADLNHDGLDEVLCSSPEATGWKGSKQGEFIVLNSATGEELWRLEGYRDQAHFPRSFAISPDHDGDGWDEIKIQALKLSSYTGDGNFHGYLSSSSYQISASNGGAIDLSLDFTSAAAWNEYRIIASGHGVGLNYELNFPVPLVLDHWLFFSLEGRLPTYQFHDFHGILDDDGRALGRIRIGPNKIPPSLIGMQPAFAAITCLPWEDWQYCSVPISLTILP